MQFLKQIETLFRTGTAGGLTDGQLLERFVERRGEDAEAAFAALVDRHGAMVLRVCRQVLRGEEDAEDAAQAAFLVLARRAGSISRRESVGCWLHGVALRVAAKARAAASRRRAHELRGGEMRTAGHVVDADLGAVENHEDWVRVHDELGALPRSFREPLILCYLDGLTQEQAAAQLHCPLGTIQSRLSRGRAKLKARLEKRGVCLSAAFSGENHLALQCCSAPQAWADATVRLAMQLSHGNGVAIAGASAATVALAEDVARAMIMTKLRVTMAMILFAAVLVTGAGAWAMHDREAAATVVATKIASPVLKPEPELVQEKAPTQPERVKRTIRGIVRDEQGRPVPKAWIGSDRVSYASGSWDLVEPLDRVRERKEPFHDEHGTIVPAGTIGKYFELRDEAGKWQPIHPADIRRLKRPAHDHDMRSPFEYQPSPEVKTALETGKNVFEVQTARGRWEMHDLKWSGPADRTDAHGKFVVESELTTRTGAVVHFASPDFSRQAVSTIRFDDPVDPIEVTLQPVRLVRARVIETPSDVPRRGTSWSVFEVDQAAGNLAVVPTTGNGGTFWQRGYLEEGVLVNVPGHERSLEMRLPAGRYTINLWSDTLDRTLDLIVPPGKGPVTLPDFRVESLAWAKTLGKSAAEIDAVDLTGKPVKLADRRGKTVVLCFWSSKQEKDVAFPELPRLAEIQKRFKAQPLVILALHDASITSIEGLGQAVHRLRAQLGAEVPFEFLLDRNLVKSGDSPIRAQVRMDRAGRRKSTRFPGQARLL